MDPRLKHAGMTKSDIYKMASKVTMSFLEKPIKVLYEDDQFMAFDKPAGVLVIPSPENESNTLVHIVNHQHKNDHWKLHPCHRLDRETSGVILFAKGKHNQQLGMEAFHQKKVKKVYWAFVQGRPSKPSGEIRSNIRDLDQKKFHRHSEGQFAITRYKILEPHRHFSVVQIEPVTGRTNQIRIQFKQLGHPLVGDRKYSFARDFAVKFRRTALHAHSLEWKNPVTDQFIKITAPLPEDMEVFLARNRN